MRMYNPEWEAIKDFQYTPLFKDVQFDISGTEIPVDHGYSLFQSLVALLPWLGDSGGSGVHPIHGEPTGRNDNLIINRRGKLVLRVPVARLDDVQVLVGKRIETGAEALQIGAAKEKLLTPFTTLYSPLVDLGIEDEIKFIEAVRTELEKMDIRCGLIPGKKRKMHLPEGEIWGYSLMLHDVTPEQSLRVQEQGLGRHRNYGCGLFVPHKSIKEVAVS